MNNQALVNNIAARLTPWNAYVWLREYARDWIQDIAQHPDEYRQAVSPKLTPNQRIILDDMLSQEAAMLDENGCYRWQDVTHESPPNTPDHEKIIEGLLSMYMHDRRRADLDRMNAICDSYEAAGEPYGCFLNCIADMP